jgi:hypothetical protein
VIVKKYAVIMASASSDHFMIVKLFSLFLKVKSQGDQIGRIFSHPEMVCCG